jgi:hypothetical protein
MFGTVNYQPTPMIQKINDFLIDETGVEEPETTAPQTQTENGSKTDSDTNN